ncbi:hypothetical protein PAMA_021966 [Pampus argenteus]
MTPVPKVRLAEAVEVCRVLTGMWQVSAVPEQLKSSGNTIPALQSLTKYVLRPGPMDGKKMEQLCLDNNIQLLTLGTLAGCLLSDLCYLRRVEPNTRVELYTASLSKYKNMIDIWGGWTLFQDLLVTLEADAKRHDC